MPVINDSQRPGKRTLAGHDKRASKKAKLGLDSSKEQMHQGGPESAVFQQVADSSTRR